MSQNNKAYVGRIMDGPTPNVTFQYVVLDQDNNLVGANTFQTTVAIHYGDTSQQIHEAMADAIRTDMSDPNIEVYFIDAPGRY